MQVSPPNYQFIRANDLEQRRKPLHLSKRKLNKQIQQFERFVNRLLLRVDTSKVDVKFLIALLERIFPQGSDNYSSFTEHLVDELFETFNERDLDRMPAEFRAKVFQYLDILDNLGIFLNKFEGGERQENGVTIIDYYYEPKAYSDLMQIFR